LPETRKQAEERAEKLGFPKTSVICLEKDDKCYIVPHGITTTAARHAYAESRDRGLSKERSAKIAHSVEEKANK